MRNQMTHRQLIALAKYLDAHSEQIRAERPSYVAVARQAGEELGFACSQNDIRAVADACEITWSPRHASGGTRASRKHVSRILARAVLEIADALDIKLDQDVRRIAHGRRVADDGRSSAGPAHA